MQTYLGLILQKTIMGLYNFVNCHLLTKKMANIYSIFTKNDIMLDKLYT